MQLDSSVPNTHRQLKFWKNRVKNLLTTKSLTMKLIASSVFLTLLVLVLYSGASSASRSVSVIVHYKFSSEIMLSNVLEYFVHSMFAVTLKPSPVKCTLMSKLKDPPRRRVGLSWAFSVPPYPKRSKTFAPCVPVKRASVRVVNLCITRVPSFIESFRNL